LQIAKKKLSSQNPHLAPFYHQVGMACLDANEGERAAEMFGAELSLVRQLFGDNSDAANFASLSLAEARQRMALPRAKISPPVFTKN